MKLELRACLGRSYVRVGIRSACCKSLILSLPCQTCISALLIQTIDAEALAR